MNFFRKASCCFVLLFVMNACQHAEHKEMDAIADSISPIQSEVAFAPPSVNSNYDAASEDKYFKQKAIPLRKLIRNADLEIQVKDLNESVQQISGLLPRFQAISLNAEFNRNPYELTQTMTIQIPPQNLDTLIKKLKNISVYVKKISESAEDVTSQYIDTEARMKTKKALEERYLQILKQARNVKEILEVEAKLSEVREEIEAKQSQLLYWDREVAMSTLNLTLYQLTSPEKEIPVGFGSRIWNGLGKGWENFLDFLILLSEKWHWFLLGPILLWLGKRLFFWFRNSKKTT